MQLKDRKIPSLPRLKGKARYRIRKSKAGINGDFYLINF